MTHYLMLKFEQKALLDQAIALAEDTFSSLACTLDCVLSADVRRNCVDRASNADLLIQMELIGPDALEVYLNHPLHLAFVDRLGAQIVQRVTFDCA